MTRTAAREAATDQSPVPPFVSAFTDRDKLGIWRRIECIMAECKRLPKTETNQDQGFDYTPYDDIAEMLRPLLAQYGVAILQEPVEFQREGTMTRIKYRYDVVNTDRPDEQITRHNYGEAVDFSDKGINKASTIAEKFFLCRLFHLSTGGDPDGVSIPAEKNGWRFQNGRQNGHQQDDGRNRDNRHHSNQAQTTASANIDCRCEQCALIVKPVKRDSETISVKSILAASQREYKKNLCADCLTSKRGQTPASPVTPEETTEQASQPPAA